MVELQILETRFFPWFLYILKEYEDAKELRMINVVPKQNFPYNSGILTLLKVYSLQKWILVDKFPLLNWDSKPKSYSCALITHTESVKNLSFLTS